MSARRALLGAAGLPLLAWAGLASCGGDGARPEIAADEGSPMQDRVVLVPGPERQTIRLVNLEGRDTVMIAAGKTLYAWYNCAGCHAPEGGGGMGPPLSDGEWIYGSDPASVYETIVRGRPNGMPTWGGRIPEDHIWKLVAYVRSLSQPPPVARIPPAQNAPTDTTPTSNDH